MLFRLHVLKHNTNDQYNYVGTLYGGDPAQMTGRGIASLMSALDDTSPLIDHPANGGRDGFYFESDNIHYHSDNIQELVFESVA